MQGPGRRNRLQRYRRLGFFGRLGLWGAAASIITFVVFLLGLAGKLWSHLPIRDPDCSGQTRTLSAMTAPEVPDDQTQIEALLELEGRLRPPEVDEGSHYDESVRNHQRDFGESHVRYLGIHLWLHATRTCDSQSRSRSFSADGCATYRRPD